MFIDNLQCIFDNYYIQFYITLMSQSSHKHQCANVISIVLCWVMWLHACQICHTRTKYRNLDIHSLQQCQARTKMSQNPQIRSYYAFTARSNVNQTPIPLLSLLSATHLSILCLDNTNPAEPAHLLCNLFQSMTMFHNKGKLAWHEKVSLHFSLQKQVKLHCNNWSNFRLDFTDCSQGLWATSWAGLAT